MTQIKHRLRKVTLKKIFGKRGPSPSANTRFQSPVTFYVQHGKLSLSFQRMKLSRRARFGARLACLFLVLVLLVTIIIPDIQLRHAEASYDLTDQESSLLPATDAILQHNISYDTKTGAYSFQNSSPRSQASSGSAVGQSATMLQASFPSSAKKGISVTDPVSKVSFSITPKFDLAPARQATSHVYYPLANGTGKLVYSPQASNVVEDLVLTKYSDDTMHFDFSLDQNQSLQARMQNDGSVNVYGSELASLGTISTGTPDDEARLQKAENKAGKNKLLFQIPAPVIKQTGGGKSAAKAHYALVDGGKTLRLVAGNLKKASFPLDIDPTVSVSSLAQLYRDTNGESNVDFNTTNGSINRGGVTGGVIDYTAGWYTSSTSTASGHFLGSSVISNGYMYVGGGISGTNTTNQSTLEYTQLSSSLNVGTWSTASLPTTLSQYKLLTYNGFLYTLGGSNGSTIGNGGCTNPTANVYYNPTQPNGAIAATWTPTTALPTALCSFGATIYNNTIYVIGGQKASGAAQGVSTVYYASILPNGSIGAWNTSSVSLPVSLYGADVQVYNGYIYVIGGYSNAATTVTLSTIYRAALNSNGSIYGSTSADWKSLPNTFVTPNGASGLANNGGGSFSTVNDGYMYVGSGCKTVTTATQTCTAINTNTYIAQINADGTVGPWSKIASSNSVTETGGSLLVFSGSLFLVNGCSAMNATSFTCNASANNLQKVYDATITDAGQIGPVTQLTPVLATGVFDPMTVINNGYIYVIGGCTNVACTTTSSAVNYAPISDSGTIGSWTVSTKTTGAANGLSSGGVVVFDNYIYITGGFTGSTGNTSATILSAQITTASYPDIAASFASVGTGATNQLPQARSNMSTVLDTTAAGTTAYIFVFGGCDGGTAYGCSTYYTTNYRYTVGPTGAVVGSGTSATGTVPALLNTHSTSNNCPGIETTWANACWTGEAAMASVIYGGYVYLIGGAGDGGGTVNVGQSSMIQYASITNGVVGAWQIAPNVLPTPIRRAAAYATNGYIYTVGGHNALGNGGSGQTYQTVAIAPIDKSGGNLSVPFTVITSSSTLAFSEWGGSVAYANGTVFEVGGCTAGNPPTTCTNVASISKATQTFQIYNAGNAGTAAWTNDTPAYATNSTGLSSVAASGYIYTAGGCTAYTFTALGPCTAVTTATSYAQLNLDGSVGNWTAGPALPAGSGYGCMVALNGYLYYIGGVNAANVPTDIIYYSKIGASGVPAAWAVTATGGATMPGPRAHIGCDTFGGSLYVGGGTSSSTSTTEGTDVNTVIWITPNASTGLITGSWASSTFTNGRRDASLVAAAGYVYVIGGYSNSGTPTYYNDVQYFTITGGTNGPLGSPTFTRPLPSPITQASAVVANGYIFVFGGASGATTTTCQNSTYIAAMNSSGQLTDWTQGIDNFTTARFGSGAAYYNGYYYVLGGYGCAASAIPSTFTVQYSGQQSQSMNSFFTRYADLTGNAYPQKFVPFVRNASIGAFDVESWKMRYVTSSTANGGVGWGLPTTISSLVKGSVYNVFAYDGTGTDIKLSQYVSLAFSISQEKSFTFPDTTSPNVSAYYLYYSPYVGSRLRNGKTFQDQQQQGFDLNLR